MHTEQNDEIFIAIMKRALVRELSYYVFMYLSTIIPAKFLLRFSKWLNMANKIFRSLKKKLN
ncbi:10815_t:CDS:1, partial [Gigaspora rosea]